MKVSSFSWLNYLINKYTRYVYLFLFVSSLCFPFNPPHNISNLINRFHLPEIAYPISYFLIVFFFILLVSKFSVPSLSINPLFWDIEKQEVRGDGWSIDLRNIEYELHLKILGTINEKSIWKIRITKPVHKSYNLLLNFAEKKEFVNILQAFKS